jgi:hypothetical protein
MTELYVDSGQMAVIPIEGIDKCGHDMLKRGGDGILVVNLGGPGEYEFYSNRDHSRADDFGTHGDHLVGTLKTSSGVVVLSDPCYVFEDGWGEGGNYSRACDANHGGGELGEFEVHKDGEVVGQGVVTSTAYGDGGYPCCVHTDQDNVTTRIEIKFVEDKCETCDHDESDCQCCYTCGQYPCECCEECGYANCSGECQEEDEDE